MLVELVTFIEERLVQIRQTRVNARQPVRDVTDAIVRTRRLRDLVREIEAMR